jgi:hypothetical protein
MLTVPPGGYGTLGTFAPLDPTRSPFAHRGERVLEDGGQGTVVVHEQSMGYPAAEVDSFTTQRSVSANDCML